MRKGYKAYRFSQVSNTGVWLKHEDIQMLAMILKYDILTKAQIIYFYSKVHNQKPSSVERKLIRWKKEKVIDQEQYGGRGEIYYFLDKNGYEVLMQEGIIEQRPKYLNRPRKKIDHYIGLRDSVIKILTQLESQVEKQPYVSLYSMPFVFREKENIKPDWVFKINDWYYDIEFDIGTEGTKEIHNKLSNYVELAKARPDEKHHLFIVLIDNVDKKFKYQYKKYGINRSVRISNLKKIALSLNVQSQSNLKITIAQTSRAHLILNKWSTHEYSEDSTNVAETISSVAADIDTNRKFNYTLEARMDESEFYLPEVEKSLFADEHLIFKHILRIDEDKTLLVKLMKEGEVSCYDQLKYLNLLARERRFKRNVDLIVAVYDTNTEMESDVFVKEDAFEHVIFTSRELLMNHSESPFRIPWGNSWKEYTL